ncbi:aminotransferase-like domain-containing protein [Caballeronia cordobensis]|nr:PLP-dependent aminotransferase family protein [Caballeronia cordobensis]
MMIKRWVPDIKARKGPIYQRIADAMAADISHGTLNRGDRLPPQRALAAAIGVDFSTISRAYAEAQRRGLIDARVGRGTFVRHLRDRAPTPSSSASTDFMVNSPPNVFEGEAGNTLWNEVSRATVALDAKAFMRYQPPAGTIHDRDVGAQWLRQRLSAVSAEQVLVCPGTQSALLVVIMMLAAKDDVLCVENLTYPGIILIARYLGIRLVGVEMDDQGAIPESVDKVCKEHRVKAFYCMPTLHNPTTRSMSLKRRMAIASVLSRHRVSLIEDDNYWPLLAESGNELPPLSSFLPDQSFYLSGLSKCLTPALRIAYLATPEKSFAERAAVILRATASMASPLSAALATRWIEDGTASTLLAAICQEVAARQSLARDILPEQTKHTDLRAFHTWLVLPKIWTRAAFAERLRADGINIALSDAFCVGVAEEAVRLSLGGPPTIGDLKFGLEKIASLLRSDLSEPSVIV